MKAKLIIEDKEIEIEISEEEYKKLQPSETGYERVAKDSDYFYVNIGGNVGTGIDNYCYADDKYYKSANYYSSDVVAGNNARADKLMRQLRRFAVEHRKYKTNFNSINANRFYIIYQCEINEIKPYHTSYAIYFGAIYFDSEEIAQAAIDEFHDELIWYFTEYKDSL